MHSGGKWGSWRELFWVGFWSDGSIRFGMIFDQWEGFGQGALYKYVT